ncbi:hypothetical protein AJM39_12620 [Listeria monocytogenes]|uniref:hypothetical protein n=1 Tax=Listeria monocytogenes TaxID=1639 RepID=UPI00086B6E9D|nr:hypothetical protein [Listeria monocytogenes]EAC4355188.1 hypothetical protein [Listeria monocytogenes]EAG6776321.1 hypothetical protein [Listeria monocytogenes]OEP31248.1 hypothetical protein AJM39_12620 [Listeria monocytogenes]
MIKTKNKDICALIFSIISFFVPFGLIISILTLISSKRSIRVEATSINKTTKVLSIISIICSILIIISAIVGAITFFSSKNNLM